MKRVVIALTVVVPIFACGLIYGQETADEPNVEYDELKVLEPLVGSYRREWTNDENGTLWESRMTVSWSNSKKMLMGELQMRSADKDAELKAQEWFPTLRHCYVWNHGTRHIEHVGVRSWRGVVDISAVKAKGDGVYSYSRLRTTVSPSGRSDATVTVTDTDMTISFKNRKNAEGESSKDIVYVMKRVSADK